MKISLAFVLFLTALPLHAEPQSDTPSQASAISLAPSVEITAASLKLVPAGSRLVVKSLRPLGDIVEVVAITAVAGLSITIHVSAKALQLSGLVVGGSLIVTAVSAGYLLVAGSEAIAFIPNETCRSHIHHRRL